MRFFRSAAAVLACGVLASCQDLTVIDKNRPSLDVSLATATNIETSVNGATRYYMAAGPLMNCINQCGETESTVVPILHGWNDAMTWGGYTPVIPGTTVLGEPPREEFDHNSDQFTANTAPFQDAYSAIAICHDVRAAIHSEGMQGDAFPQWQRSSYFCKMLMGFSHLYVGTLFDKGYAVNDDLKRPIDANEYINNWLPHHALVDHAKKQIREGIEEAKAMDTTTSTLSNWINGVAYTQVDMAKIAYGYLARAEIWKAANKEQREDISKGGVVDWNKVIQYVDSSLQSTWTLKEAPANFPVNNTGGITGPNYVTKGTNANRTFRSADLYMLMYSAANNFFRMHHKVLGPADTTGAYVTYLKTPVQQRGDTVYASPDRRLPRGPCLVGQSFNQGGCLPRHVSTSTNVNYVGNPLAGDGNYFQLIHSHLSLTFNTQPNDPWRRASYMFMRFGATPNARRLATSTTLGIHNTDFQPIMTRDEQELYRAEAYMRLGTPALALPIINSTRQPPLKGGLPPVGVNGPTQPYPQCVPHAFRNAEQCGDLWDALLWEMRMEKMGIGALHNFVDWRGFGYLDPGTPVFFPVSFRETRQLGLPYYTYGGNLPGTSGSTVQCGSGDWVSIGCVNYQPIPRLPKPPQ